MRSLETGTKNRHWMGETVLWEDSLWKVCFHQDHEVAVALVRDAFSD